MVSRHTTASAPPHLRPQTTPPGRPETAPRPLPRPAPRRADSSCPVCRYCEEPPDRPECAGCGAVSNLWICLICGFIGCGRCAATLIGGIGAAPPTRPRCRLPPSLSRPCSASRDSPARPACGFPPASPRYAAGHAVSHYQQTGHCYSMEVETQRVWDYLNDGYVHRLIASKTHGHLVELTPVRRRRRSPAVRPVFSAPEDGREALMPGNPRAHPVRARVALGPRPPARRVGGRRQLRRRLGRGAPRGSRDAGGAPREQARQHSASARLARAALRIFDAVSVRDGLSDAATRLPPCAFQALEYNQLLTNQLDSQRQYFESLLHTARAEAERRALAARWAS